MVILVKLFFMLFDFLKAIILYWNRVLIEFNAKSKSAEFMQQHVE